MPKTKIIDLSKRMSVFACSISLLYFLGGCASNFTGESISLKLDGLGKPRVLMMQTQVIRGKDSYSMDMIVDVSKERLTVVGSSLGLRVFTLSYDGTRVAEGFGLGLPFYIPNRLVVDDVTLILTSKEILKDSLPAGCSLYIEDNLEKIYCGDQLVVSVKKIQLTNGNSEIFLNRSLPEYQLKIVMSEVQ